MKKLLETTILAGAALGMGVSLAAPAMAQESGAGIEAADIVVTARRQEERLQDVPVSVTVFNQDQLSNRNISSPADLVTYTPSLSANVRFGGNNATFSIRGFAQEQRTTASVATYFGEAVSVRGMGGSSTTSGDGASPGALFDLQNVQVLNGPQGTLFGRNTTGGAVLLVPQRPTDEFGGYLEASAGDYDMRRVQGVLNIPLADTARLRIGMDRQEREGYLNNLSPIGPDDFNDVNYESYRVSFVAELAPNLENYTIATYSHSLTNGTLGRAIACIPPGSPGEVPAANGAVRADLACSDANLSPVTNQNDEGHYDVRNSMPDPLQSQNVWQVQNITTWDVSDNFTIKNIMSYGEFVGHTRSDVYGSYFLPTAGAAAVFVPNANPLLAYTIPAQAANPNINNDNPEWFSTSGLGNFDGAATRTYTEELQFSGRAFGDRMNWQAGLYYEETDPQRLTGSLGQTYWRCNTKPDESDPATWSNCNIDAGNATNSQVATFSGGGLHFQTQAIYFQTDYDFTDRLTGTLGLRYTWDRTDGESIQKRWFVPTTLANPLNPRSGYADITDTTVLPWNSSGAGCSVGSPANECVVRLHNNTEAPTWTVGLDYQLTDDDMVYAKYSRGYRQGSINLFAPTSPDRRLFRPEQLDAYEIGGKFGFDGPVPGIFNVALFYNDLTDAQLQTGFILPGPRPTTAILSGNATTYGAELSTVLQPTDDLNVAVSYTWMDTNVDRAPDLGGLTPTTAYVTDQPLTFVPENKLTITANYTLPLPDSIGEIELGATWSYIDRAMTYANNPEPFRYLNSYELLNLNLNWNGIFGAPVDGSLFVTNALDEEYNAHQTATLAGANYESGTAGPPRMIGARLRYSFGGEAN